VIVITKELALKIARKLKAENRERPGKAHDIAVVYPRGTLRRPVRPPARFTEDLGHDHIPSQIYVRASQARPLGQCPLDREGWIAILREKGML